MDALISLMQFDIVIMDVLWIFNLIQNTTLNFHRGLRVKMDLVLTSCLFLCSIGVAFVHGLEGTLFLSPLLGFSTLWCIAYVFHDQNKIFNHSHRIKS